MNFESYQSVVEEPLSSEWQCNIWSAKDSALQSQRNSARRRLVNAARAYSEHLATLAVNALGENAANDQLLDGNPDEASIVMTGHQPVIFHSGLTYKYELTEDFARRQKTIGIAVVIDTDEGDAGEFSCPTLLEREDSGNHTALMQHLVTAKFSFASSPGLFAVSKRRSSAEVAELCQQIAGHLHACGLNSAETKFSLVSNRYRQLESCSMLETNLITRRAASIGNRLMEVRLSELCGFPEIIQFFAALLARPFSYARCCNDVLRQFREKHSIRNSANPFPDLKVDEQECELPFWLVNLGSGTRSIPVVRRIDGVPTLCGSHALRIELIPGHEAAALFSLWIAQTPLVPRGPLITATMRLLFSDIFVHGTGGGRYDQFTDELIEAWWKETASPLAVASASRYLFDAERTELARLEALSTQLRDLQFNPQRFFGTGIFSPTLEQQLRSLLRSKEELVASLKQARASGQSAEQIGRDIQQIGDQIRQAVTREFEPQIESVRQIPKEAADTIRSRTWPWFFF